MKNKKLENIVAHEKSLDRWGDGTGHHPKSLELMETLMAVDP